MKQRANNGQLKERYKRIKELQGELTPKQIQTRLGITKRDYYNAINYFEKYRPKPVEKSEYYFPQNFYIC